MVADFNSFLDECLAEAESENSRIVKAFGMLKEALAGRPLVLYGQLSMVGSSLLDIFTEYGLPVRCFCDPQSDGTENGSHIIDPQTLKNDFANAMVAICFYSEDNSYSKNLEAMGFSPQDIIPWEWSQLIMTSRIYLLKSQSFHKHIAKYSWAYEFFEDEISKQTVLDRLRMYLCETPMEVNAQCPQYFEDGYISLGEREIFVDGGAHIGESVRSFLQRLELKKGGYAHIFSFEPDSGNYAKTVRNTSELPNITVIPKGLWSVETELTFFEKNDTLGSSFVNNPELETNGKVVQRVPVTSLDTFFAGVPDSELPTLIKMDIEGAEKEALIGTSEIIRRVKPKLAICAYHKPEDIYVLPQTIMKIRDDYKFALRQHVAGVYETVLYAV